MISVTEAFDHGTTYTIEGAIPASEKPWTPNARFAGVSMKHLVTGKETNGAFSTHLVRVEAGFEIGTHTHATQFELHEVLSGSGECIFAGRTLEYIPGVSTVVPAGVEHRVMASGGELIIKATFVPALC